VGRSFAHVLAEGSNGGRVKVYGCSPGCLLASLAVSVFLTLAVNGCIHLL
jgi:hypothetical protein